MYRDMPAKLEPIDREPMRWLDGVVFGLAVIAGAVVILVGSWLYNAP